MGRSLHRPPRQRHLSRAAFRGTISSGCARASIHCLSLRSQRRTARVRRRGAVHFRSGHVVLRAGRNPPRLRLRRQERRPGPGRGEPLDVGSRCCSTRAGLCRTSMHTSPSDLRLGPLGVERRVSALTGRPWQLKSPSREDDGGCPRIHLRSTTRVLYRATATAGATTPHS